MSARGGRRGPVTLALAGDTMLGRGVAETLASAEPESLVAPEVVAAAQEADVFVLNLECSISTRGERWPDPRKPFFFRGPPAAADVLAHLGVDCVTLANNHALDFGADALLDTIEHLAARGIAAVGAGRDLATARRAALLDADGFRVAVVGVTDHPAAYAAGPAAPGVALAALEDGVPEWLTETIHGAAATADAVLVTPHWGPNMAVEPSPAIRSTAAALLAAGATLVAGHSAHVFHGVEGPVLYDLGDFLDDYAVDPVLRNDLGLLFLVTLDEGGPRRLEAVPLRLEYCRTRLARGGDARRIAERFRARCARLGTRAVEEDGRLVVDWRASRPA